MAKLELSIADVDRFLRGRYETVRDIALLKGGAWSTAFGFSAGGRPLVVRFGQHGEDYAKDRMAGGWARPLLPTPAVIDIGAAFDGAFAVSRRLAGDKLDTLPPARLAIAIDALLDSLGALLTVTLPGEGYGVLATDGSGAHRRWRDFLTAVPERDDERLRGWRPRLAAEPAAQWLFDRAQRALEQLAPRCPEQRHVIHSDLLYGNVLVSADNKISAIFDWGNALVGDPLYDIAWLIFCAPWYPDMDPVRVRESAAAQFAGADVEQRLHCYQLHIGMASLQYQAFAGLYDDLAITARHLTRLLRSV